MSNSKRSVAKGAGNMGRHGLVGGFLLSLLLTSFLPASAHKRGFAWTYEWFTPAKGEKEVELWLTYKSEEKEWQPWVEYEFAASPRHAVGLYLLSESAPEKGLHFQGWKLENRYRFGQFRPNRWLHAAYLEVAKERQEPYELEGKWLLSRYTKKDEALALNLIAEKELKGGENVEWRYAAGWSKPLSPQRRAGIEAFGSFTEREHFVGPTVTYDVSSRNVRLVLGSGMGLGKTSGQYQLRAVTEFEFF